MKNFICKLLGLPTVKEYEEVMKKLEFLKKENEKMEEVISHIATITVVPQEDVEFEVNGKKITGKQYFMKGTELTVNCLYKNEPVKEFNMEEM